MWRTGRAGWRSRATYLGYLSGGSLTIGNANDTSTLTVGAYGSWNAPVTFLTKSRRISVIGDQTATGSGAFTFTGGPVTLTGNITTAGGNVTFNPAVTLGQDDTVNAGSGTVTFGSTVNGDYNLTAAPEASASAGRWGGTTPLAAVSLTSTSGLTPARHQRRLDLRADHRRHRRPDPVPAS